MIMGARRTLLVGSLVTAALGAYHGAPLVLAGADKRDHLPGRTSRGHEAFESACATCHTPFRGVTNDACKRCHEEGLAAAEDSHPESKFTDPRNATRVAALDARACVTCHREHVPDRTNAGVTLPADFCGACHQDIRHERASHASFSFEGCARAGCHRFHDNRGLYEGFLAKHQHEPENLPKAVVLLVTRTAAAGKALTVADADAPPASRTEAVMHAWSTTAHARGGVGCKACHDVRDAATGTRAWKDHPGTASCEGCHGGEHASFLRGQHGVRTAVGLSPLTPAMARLPMKPEARGRTLDCESCHGAHAYDTARAAADACLGCHDDRHSRGWATTRHALAFRREQSGAAAPGTGVSCATCHLPRVARRAHGTDEVSASHDVSAALRPRDKMLRAVCVRCHGLGFAIDALADGDLVQRNFNGRPAVHVESLEMVERRAHEDQGGGG
ncbi:NrfA-putative nitrite reduction protein [Minicystis rosea]|nr:NrfA-putative nitrite reduction protein [Minicystis rosea]